MQHQKVCAFCEKKDPSIEHLDECLEKHCREVKDRTIQHCVRENLIRVVTFGPRLRSRKLDIPLSKVRREPEDLEKQIKQRIWHQFRETPGQSLWKLVATKQDGTELVDMNGRILGAGSVIQVCVDGDSREHDDEQEESIYLDATPDLDTLGSTDMYRSFDNRVGYVVSEFVDNSLMALMRKFERIGIERIGDSVPVIRIHLLKSADNCVALCIEDDATGISEQDLDRMVKLRAKLPRIEETKCLTESRDLYLDASISQYGVGAKNAGFVLGSILKIITKEEGQQHVLEVTMDKNDMRTKKETWALVGKRRMAGDGTITSSTPITADLETKFGWTKERLRLEKEGQANGGLAWDKLETSGSAIFIFDIKDNLTLENTTVKEALSTKDGLLEMCADLVDIYFWFLHPPDLSFLARPGVSSSSGGMQQAVKMDIDVALRSNAATETHRLSRWGAGSQMPFEKLVEQAMRPSRPRGFSIQTPPPLRKIVYVLCRDRHPSTHKWRTRWTGEWMLSYCPLRGGKKTRPSDPKQKGGQGYGSSRVYWHGRLVPNTSIQPVAWLQNKEIIRFVTQNKHMARHARSEAAAARKSVERQQFANENVVGAMFMNWRAQISTDKFFLHHFKQQDIDIDVAVQMQLGHGQELNERQQNQLDAMLNEKLNKPVSGTNADNIQLIISETKLRTEHGEPQHAGEETSLLAGIQCIYRWISEASQFHDEISKLTTVADGQITSVSFLAEEYAIGDTVQFLSGKKVSERELWIGEIKALNLKAEQGGQRGNVVANRQLEAKEFIEVEIAWLPNQVAKGMTSKVTLGHLSAPSQPPRINVDETFADRFRNKLELFAWSNLPIEVVLKTPVGDGACKSVRMVDGDPGADVIFPQSAKIEEALRCFLAAKKINVEPNSTHLYYVIMLPAPEGAPTSFNDGTTKFGYTFRSPPNSTLSRCERTHPSVVAVLKHLEDTLPAGLAMRYLDRNVRLWDASSQNISSQVVIAGSKISEVLVQVTDKLGRVVTHVPSPKDNLTMLQPLRIRDAQTLSIKGKEDWKQIFSPDNTQFLAAHTWKGEVMQDLVDLSHYRQQNDSPLDEGWRAFRMPKSGHSGHGQNFHNFANACIDYKMQLYVYVGEDPGFANGLIKYETVVSVKPAKPAELLLEGESHDALMYFCGEELSVALGKQRLSCSLVDEHQNLRTLDSFELIGADEFDVMPLDTAPAAAASGRTQTWRFKRRMLTDNEARLTCIKDAEQQVRLGNVNDTLKVKNSAGSFKSLRLNPTDRLNFSSFTKDIKLRCEVDKSEWTLELGKFLIYPGEPKFLKPVRLSEGMTVTMAAKTLVSSRDADAPSSSNAGATAASLCTPVEIAVKPGIAFPPICLFVRDRFNRPTRRCRTTVVEGTDNKFHTLKVIARCSDGDAKLIGTTSVEVDNASCAAVFQNLKLNPSNRLRSDKRIQIDFEVDLLSEVTAQLFVTLEKKIDRKPAQLILTRNAVPIHPDKSTGDPVFTIEGEAGSSIDDLAVTILNADEDELPDASIALPPATGKLASGAVLPSLQVPFRVGSPEDKVITVTGADFSAVVRLIPRMLLSKLSWRLEQLATPIIVGADVWNSLTVTVIDMYGNSRQPNQSEPRHLVFSHLIDQQASGTQASELPVHEQQNGTTPSRVVGLVGRYRVRVESLTTRRASQAAELIKPSDWVECTLTSGALVRLGGLQCSLDDKALVPSCGILTAAEHGISLCAQDEGGNPVDDALPILSQIRSVKVSSVNILNRSVVCHRQGSKISLPDLPILPSSPPSQKLQLKLEAEFARTAAPATRLPSLDVNIGRGFKKSSHIIRLSQLAPNVQSFFTGMQMPEITFQMHAEDETVTDFASIEDSALSCKIDGADLELIDLSTSGAGKFSGQNIFEKVGTVRATVVYTEKRNEWAFMPQHLREVRLHIDFHVQAGNDKALPKLVQPPPHSGLFLTTQNGHDFNGRLYSVKHPRNLAAFEPQLQLVDQFGNRLDSTFSATITLHKSAAAAASSAAPALQQQPLGTWHFDGINSRLDLARSSEFLFAKVFRDNSLAVGSYILKCEAKLMSGQKTPPTDLFEFIFTAFTQRDELLHSLQTFKEAASRHWNERKEVKRQCEQLLNRQIATYDNVDSCKRELEDMKKNLWELELQLEEKRPAELKNFMPEVSMHTWHMPGVLGMVGELLEVQDPHVAATLSRTLREELSAILVLDKSTADDLKRLNQQKSLCIRNLLEVSRFAGFHPAGKLPHLQPGQLKNSLSQMQGQQLNIHRLAELVNHNRAVTLGLDLQHAQQLIQKLVHSNLVVNTKEEALEYSRLVWSHPAILCLDTGAYTQQGGMESLSRQQPRAAAPGSSLFLNEDRFKILKQKNNLMKNMRKKLEISKRLQVLKEKESEWRKVLSEAAEKRRQLAELQKLDQECAEAGQSRKSDIDVLANFVDKLLGSKRPASSSPFPMN